MQRVMPSRATVGSWLAALALAGLVLLAGTYWVLVGTTRGQRFDIEAFVGHYSMPVRFSNLSEDLLSRIEVPTVAAAVIALVAIGAVRRMWWRGLCAAGGFGIAICMAEVLKRVLPRLELADSPRLYLPEDLNTFPSGHATIVASAAMAFLLVAGTSARPWLAVAVALVVSGASTGVLIAAWHRGSDAIGGVGLSVFVMSVAALAALLGERSGRIAPTVNGTRAGGYRSAGWAVAFAVALVIMLVSVASVWAAGAIWGNDRLFSVQAFEAMTSVIIAVTWVAVMLYGWAVRRLV